MMESRGMPALSAAVLGALVASGLALGGYFVEQGFLSACGRERYVAVRGLVDRLESAKALAQTEDQDLTLDPSGAWLGYHNPATGLSFQYPAALRIHERNPRSFGLPQAEEITDLVGDTKVNSGIVVLRFIVSRGKITPDQAAVKAKSLREEYASETDPRKTLTPMRLDGHEALVTVSCGRAACQWTLNILQPRECKIVSLVGAAQYEEGLPPPHDGLFPLVSIIRTVHFDTASK